MSNKFLKLLQRKRVPLGFLFGILFLIFARPNLVLWIAGAAVAIVGLAVRAWSAGHIRKNRILTVSGPYAFTRNPLYLGSFIIGVGFCISAGVWWIAVLFVVLFMGIYLSVMSVEADELRNAFGDDYREYAKHVSLFLPWFSKYQGNKRKFSLELYKKYREYEAAIGVAAVWVILGLKAYLLP